VGIVLRRIKTMTPIELRDKITNLELDMIILKGRISAAARMLEPVTLGDVGYLCICEGAPWQIEEYDPADCDYGFNDPSQHETYCPVYLRTYLEALANGWPLPDEKSQAVQP
jgi:hypothetical protein